MGLVSEVFDESKLKKLPGSSAIGHVRYATAGASVLKNVQPFVAGYRFGSLAVAHNGNLVNYSELRAKLEEIGSIFNTSSDTEVVSSLMYFVDVPLWPMPRFFLVDFYNVVP
jgi:amidophosphoribosyltransferase